jgi:hypothetical protein
MGREYKITCTPLRDSELTVLLRKLPSPIQRPQMLEIYNYCVKEDGYYFVDHLVDRSIASTALQLFLDAALSTDQSITITES